MSRTCPECHTQYEDEILHCPEDGLDLTVLSDDDELIGRSIGSYDIVRVLGKGGMGAVYMAEHPVIGSRVAIKFLHPQFSTDRKIVDRFFNEARAVNVIGHDNILKILDLNVTEDNRHYFIMEFLHGKALQDLINPDAPMPLSASGPILLQVCEALQAAHDNGIVHRDLKPDNVYLTVHKGKKNFVKVVDFGIAKLTDETGQSTGKTQTGMVMGTPAYMSPEQAGGMTSKIDGRSDIYSLGCMSFQMATGRLPFPGTSFGEVLIGHLQLPPPRPRDLAPELPEEFEAVILKCLEKKQEDRYQSMRAVHDAIAAVMEKLAITRDLPAADPAEIAAAGGTKTKSTPGVSRTPRPPQQRRTPVLQTPRPQRNTGAALRSSMAAPRPSTPAPQPTTFTPPPPAPARARGGLFLGLGAGALVAMAGLGLLLWRHNDESRREVEQAARLAAERVAQEAQKVAQRVDAEHKQQRAEEKVFLSVVSEPLGANVEATWKDGSKTAVTPFDLSVPRNVKVHFAYSRRDYLAYATDVIADGPQVVNAQLTAEPRAATPARVVRGKADRKAKPASTESKDDTVPVEF
ncbi:MAG TPA: protein kinase [Myxococcales bacterium]|nr:protein kinase [Myxococcales bacterium]